MPGVRCDLCLEERGSQVNVAREMMYGLRHPFRYVECQSCGCLALIDVPTDMSLYYPKEYYSFNHTPASGRQRMFQFVKDAICFLPFGSLLVRFRRNAEMRSIFRAGLRPKWRVLDVGCGSGELIARLTNAGCKHVTGIDPFVRPEQISKLPEADIRICDIESMRGTEWDLIMFNHSFEHLPDPVTTLFLVHDILAPKGRCLLRMPMVNWAWQHYKTDWVQLDAPRHLYIFTDKAIHRLAERTGLRVLDIVYDSAAFQFIGSEMYRRDIPLRGPRELHFDQRQLREFSKFAKKLNDRGLGDQASVYLANP